MDFLILITTFWNSIPTALQTLLLGAGGELTGSLTAQFILSFAKSKEKKALEKASKQLFKKAGAYFLSYLNLPNLESEYGVWKNLCLSLLTPILSDDEFIALFNNATLHGNKPADLEKFSSYIWAKHYGEGGEQSLPWREGFHLTDAIKALIGVFEYEVESFPELHTFLLATRTKHIIYLLEKGIRIENFDNFLSSLQLIAEQQNQLTLLMRFLVVNGLSFQGNNVLIDGQIINELPQNSSIKPIFDILAQAREKVKEDEQNNQRNYLLEFRAHIRQLCEYQRLDSLMNVLSQSLKLSPIRVPIKENLIRVEFSKIYNPKSDSNKKFRSLNKRLKPSGPLAIDLLVNGESQIVIIGDAGSGKTTLLQYLAWKKSSDNELLPLFLSLKKIDVELSRTNEIFDCILNSLTLHKTGMAKNNLKELIKAEINCKKVLWLLDGADEITIHKQEIKEFTDNLFLEGYSIVLSSRQFENQNPNINPEIYNTCSLEPKDINEFLRKFYTEAAESLEISESQKWISRKINHIIEKIGLNPAFFLFCKKPLILAILAILGLELSPNEKFPRTEREFFKIYIERIVTNNELERRENQRDQILPEITDSKITKEILLWGFYKISLTLFLEIKTKKINQLISVIKQILSDELIQILKIDQFRACATAEAIIEFWRLTGLFEINNIPNQETLNSVFSVIEEYGAAIGFLNECKKDEPTLWEIIKLNSHNIEFCCVIAMTIAELKDSNYIFRQLLIEEERNNSNHCPILIASRALAEGAVTTKEIKKEVISKLRNITTAHHRSSIASLAEMHLAMMHEVETLKEISLDKNVIRKVRIVAADYLFFLGESSASLTSLLSMGTPGLGSSRGTDPLIRNYGNSILYAYSLLYPEIDSPLDESFEYSESFSLPPEKNQEEVIDIILALGDNPYLDFGLAQRIVSIFGAMKQVDALLQFSKKAKGKNCLIAIAEELWKLGHIDEAIEIWVSVLTDCNRSLYEQEKAANGILEYPSRLNSSQIRIIKLIDKKSFHYRIIEKINNIIQCATDNDKKPII